MIRKQAKQATLTASQTETEDIQNMLTKNMQRSTSMALTWTL